MKKGIAYLLLLMMLFMNGCGQKQPEPGTTAVPSETVAPETTEAETTAPETEPKLESAWIQGEGVPEVLLLLHRGDRVEVLSWIDETHAWVKAGEQEGSVEKQLLQMANEEDYAQWTGYSM